MFRRIYSVNLACYLASKGYEYTIYRDEDKKYVAYFIFDADVQAAIEEYQNNEELQNFIAQFKYIKKEIYNVVH